MTPRGPRTHRLALAPAGVSTRDHHENTIGGPDMQPPKTARAWVLALTSAASLMVALDALVVTTALGAMRVDLGASIEELEWTVNAYTLSLAVLLMTGAAVGERFGRRRAFVAGIGL